jgi:nucleoid DNA-binding protein
MKNSHKVNKTYITPSLLLLVGTTSSIIAVIIAIYIWLSYFPFQSFWDDLTIITGIASTIIVLLLILSALPRIGIIEIFRSIFHNQKMDTESSSSIIEDKTIINRIPVPSPNTYFPVVSLVAGSTGARGMSKAEFIEKLAEARNISKKEATSYLQVVGKIVSDELRTHGEVTIPGLIKVRVVVRKATPARERINPFTKQIQKVPAKPKQRIVEAVPSGILKELE